MKVITNTFLVASLAIALVGTTAVLTSTDVQAGTKGRLGGVAGADLGSGRTKGR